MKDFFNKIFKRKEVVNTKMYSNAYLYNLLGKDYDKIMQYALGNGWSHESLINLYEKINGRIQSDFTKSDKDENILLKIRGLYKESLEKVFLEEHGTSGIS